MPDSRFAEEFGWNWVLIGANWVLAQSGRVLCNKHLAVGPGWNCTFIASNCVFDTWEPAGGLCDSANLNQAIPLEFTKKSSYLVTAEAREDPLEFFESRTHLG
jgi:hypothetical protein